MDHLRFLPLDHKFQDSKSFNEKFERRSPPELLFGDQIFAQVSDLRGMKFAKTILIPKRNDNWKKSRIFSELPY